MSDIAVYRRTHELGQGQEYFLGLFNAAVDSSSAARGFIPGGTMPLSMSAIMEGKGFLSSGDDKGKR